MDVTVSIAAFIPDSAVERETRGEAQALRCEGNGPVLLMNLQAAV